jgi:hypothetical protein
VLVKEGIPVKRVKTYQNFAAGDVIVSCNPEVLDSVSKLYPVKLVHKEFRCGCVIVQPDSSKSMSDKDAGLQKAL